MKVLISSYKKSEAIKLKKILKKEKIDHTFKKRSDELKGFNLFAEKSEVEKIKSLGEKHKIV